MDIVAILEASASELPSGEYSTGISAIIRHVKAAIRHFERDGTEYDDACTDAIYRTNQAYEGSLKEAFRVLAGQDPSGKSPYDIEQYLTSNNVVRPRVLTQLTRYRQDYRNPSTHDYKLDFDSDEALLAIVSVCGFARLLVKQIQAKLDAQAAQQRAALSSSGIAAIHSASEIEKIARGCLVYAIEARRVPWFEFERGLAALLQQDGHDVKLYIGTEEDPDGLKEGAIWDVAVMTQTGSVGIDARVSSESDDRTTPINYENLKGLSKADEKVAAVSLSRTSGASDYILLQGDDAGRAVYLVCTRSNNIDIENFSLTFDHVVYLSDTPVTGA